MQIETIHEVSQEVIEAFNRLIPQLTSNRQPPNRDHLNDIIQSDNAQILVARHNNKIIGTLTLICFKIPTGQLARIDDVVVDKAHRNQGIAKRLIHKAIKIAKANKMVAVDLTSRPSRIEANHLYKKMGFQLRETNLYRYILY